jgi:hypothetical protein
MTWSSEIRPPAALSPGRYPVFIELNAGRSPELAWAPKPNKNRLLKLLGQNRDVRAEWTKLHSQMLHICLFTKYCEEDKTRKVKWTAHLTMEKKDKGIENFDLTTT